MDHHGLTNRSQAHACVASFEKQYAKLVFEVTHPTTQCRGVETKRLRGPCEVSDISRGRSVSKIR
jgi:hypothetical protein